MGYYTTFYGEVEGSGPVMDKFMEDAESGKAFGTSGWDFPILDFTEKYINGGEPITWYDHNESVLELSLEYPNLLFTLRGEGEEPGDLWKNYYRNGKMLETKAEVTFPVPDLDKELPADDSLEKEIRESNRRKLQAEILHLQNKLDELDA